ncbi:hypothetical protein BC835DRAFT_1308347 [Cytidiella melzeri]|nr:hypothetical protein BC835DRAFT_1308347 [Cytidiella melzeri]
MNAFCAGVRNAMWACFQGRIQNEMEPKRTGSFLAHQGPLESRLEVEQPVRCARTYDTEKFHARQPYRGLVIRDKTIAWYIQQRTIAHVYNCHHLDNLSHWQPTDESESESESERASALYIDSYCGNQYSVTLLFAAPTHLLVALADIAMDPVPETQGVEEEVEQNKIDGDGEEENKESEEVEETGAPRDEDGDLANYVIGTTG